MSDESNQVQQQQQQPRPDGSPVVSARLSPDAGGMQKLFMAMRQLQQAPGAPAGR